MTAEVIVYCDESESRGEFFSNFFGGALVRSRDVDHVRSILEFRKAELNFHGEMKWNKVTANYLDKYTAVMDTFFDFVKDDSVKVRIMFTQNVHEAMGLSQDHRDIAYFLHYY